MTDTDPEADEEASAGKVRDDDDCPLDDRELLLVLKAERAKSVGFDHDPELKKDRDKALEYYKGEMKDVPSLANRSKAVDSTTSDTIDTLIPDLLEIFTSGDDVVTFRPRGPQDEAQAQQETDYINTVVFEENGGWLTLATAFKDALLCKIGVFSWWWENKPEDTWESFTGKTRGEVAAILQSQGGAPNLVAAGRVKATPSAEKGGEPLYDIEVRQEGPDGRVRIAAWPPEDFTVARDAVVLSEAAYCAGRSRPRAQSLKAEGYDAELIDQLPECDAHTDETARARDNADESDTASGNGGAQHDMRQVEVIDHFIRIPGDDGQLELWRVKTGKEEAVLLSKERVERFHYDVITPDIAAHRLYGRSMADIVGELQRIKTALTRGWLDSIYFALNGRYYVDMQKVNEFTFADLLDNRPGMPVRGKGEGAVTPLASAPIRSDVFSAGLEYFSVATEHRTGVMRNAQGLNPDTLHDTASGAEMLMTAAQKRVRMIARIFAETGVKGLMLGVHALLREHASKGAEVRLRGSWVQVDPTTWGERNDMTIELGLGSAGRAQDVATLTKVLELQEKAATTPGAQMLVSPANAYNALTDMVSKMGSKKGSMYFTDPATVPPTPPQPNPEVVKAQMQAQTEQAKIAAKSQFEGQKLQQEGALKAAGMQQQGAQDAAAQQQDAQLKTAIAAGSLHVKMDQLDRETALKAEEIRSAERIAAFKGSLDAHVAMNPARVELGGQPG